MDASLPLALEAVSKTFRTKGRKKQVVNALLNISLRLKKGEVAGLLGPNGAGKTTLIKILCGLVYPDKGRVLAFGSPFEQSRKQALSRMGVLLEGHRHIFWPLTVVENLKYFGMLKNVPGPALREDIDRLVQFMGLEDKRDVPVRFLSQGMRQKLSVAVTLLGNPDVLLLDEPTQGLDVESLRDLKQRIVRLAKEFQKAILLSTHQMEVAQELCDRILILQEGRILADAPTPELMGYFKGQNFMLTIKGLPSFSHESQPFVALGMEPSLDEHETVGANGIVRIRVGVKNGEGLFDVLQGLKAKGAEIVKVEELKRSLEEVFMEILGGKKGDG